MKEPIRQRRENDVSIFPIALAVLAGLWCIGVFAQWAGPYLTHGRAPAAAPAASTTPAAKKSEATPAAPTEKAVAATPAPAPAAAPAPVAPAPAPAAAALATSSGLTKLALAGGEEIEVAGNGVESKLLAFITDTGAAIDNKKWFDFDRLNFETGSARLTADSKAQVANMAAILKAFPNVKLKIGGYTDNVGKPDMNLSLSGNRAKAVVDALTASGIAGERLESEGYGEQFPIADNATPEGRTKNRRIAVSVRAK